MTPPWIGSMYPKSPLIRSFMFVSSTRSLPIHEVLRPRAPPMPTLSGRTVSVRCALPFVVPNSDSTVIRSPSLMPLSAAVFALTRMELSSGMYLLE